VTLKTALRAALACALAVVWSLAAYLLWQTKVPSSLRTSNVDPHQYFTPAQLHAAASFSSVNDLLFWLTTLAEIVALAIFARYGARWARESAAGPIGTGMLLGMLGFALVWVVQLPFGVLELWWQRRHHISRVGYVAFLFGDWSGLGGKFASLCLALVIVMGFARVLGDRWWIAAAPVFVAIALLFAFIGPYLTPTHRLNDPALRRVATELEKKEHVRHVPVVVETIHDVTSLPNAEAMGLGPSRRVVLFDTLTDGRFSTAELKVVLAHELGHLERNHIWKDVGWYALFAFPGTFLISLAARRRGGMRNPAAVPFALLALVVLSLLALPLQNAISRHLEQEADWMALQTTHDPAAATGLFRRFVPTTLDEPDPSAFEYVMLENHPTIMQRIAMVRAWQTTQGR
jgi:STE24 endopeptidase